MGGCHTPHTAEGTGDTRMFLSCCKARSFPSETVSEVIAKECLNI